MTTLYVSTTGAGRQDGSSWQNAATLQNLNTLIDKAGPGGEVLLRADQGAYKVTSPITISEGGNNGTPVTIRGVDGAGRDMNAQIVGTRPENWKSGDSQGSEVFRLVSGADNLNFENLGFKNIGNGAFRAGDDISNLSIENVTAKNVQRFFENNISGKADSASVDGLTIKDVDIDGYSSGAIRLRYNTSDVVIENVSADSMRQPGGQYVFGVILDGTAHDVLLRNVDMRNNNGTAGSNSYWNGDGFTTERGVYNVRFENTKASGNTDAGYDLKSSDTVLVNAYAEGNSRNYRFWSDSITVQDSKSVNPKVYGGTVGEAHVWVRENGKAELSNFSIVDNGAASAKYFQLEGNGKIVADKLPAGYLGKSIVEKGGSISLGDVDPVNPLPDDDAPQNPSPTTPPKPPVDAGPVPPQEPPTQQPQEPEVQQPAPQPQQPPASVDNIVQGTAASDILSGGAGNDRLIGAGGFDFLSGGKGNDVFVFNEVAEIGNKRYNRDVISDFQSGVDKIDLSGIDANTATQGNGTFSFIGEGTAFTQAGQLRWSHQKKGSQEVTTLEGDVNGDGNGDFQLEISGHVDLTPNDIVL